MINDSLHCAMTDSCSLGSNSSPNPRSFCSNSRFGTASPTTTRESIWPFPLGHFPAESSRQNCSLARAIIMTYFQEGSGLFSAPNDGGMLQQVSKRINATWRRQCGDGRRRSSSGGGSSWAGLTELSGLPVAVRGARTPPIFVSDFISSLESRHGQESKLVPTSIIQSFNGPSHSAVYTQYGL